MDRLDSEDIKNYIEVNPLEQISVNTLLDFHYSVGEVKDYCEDLLECFKREHRLDEEDVRFAELCAKETLLLEDMGIVLSKILKEHKETIEAIRKSASIRRKEEELKSIKIKKEAK